MTDTPRIHLPFVPEGTLDPAAGLNLALVELDALVQTEVLDMNLTAPPGSPVDGELHIVNSPATGAWVGEENNLAQYVGEGDFWRFYTAGEEVFWLLNRANGTMYFWDVSNSPANWEAITGGGGGGGGPSALQVACSDLVTDLTAGTFKGYVRSPGAFTISEVRASLIAASSSGAVTVDINVNGSTILSTKLTIDQGEQTSVTAATPPVITNTAIADDDEITIDIDGAGTDARGLIVSILAA